jgi:hypothetical protein
VITGTTDYTSASDIAEAADCSPDGARDALAQLVEMGVAERRDGRPATYCRNGSYFRWKRIENLAANNSAAELRERIDDLIEDVDGTVIRSPTRRGRISIRRRTRGLPRNYRSTRTFWTCCSRSSTGRVSASNGFTRRRIRSDRRSIDRFRGICIDLGAPAMLGGGALAI